MKQCIREIKFILNEEEKRKSFFLFFLMLIGGGLELIGVAGIFPVISAITSTGTADFGRVRNLCLLLIVVYIAKNIFLSYMYRCIFKFSFDGRRRLSADMFERYLMKPYAFHLSANIAVLQRSVRADVDGFFNVVKALLQMLSEIMICFISRIRIVKIIIFFNSIAFVITRFILFYLLFFW